MPRCETEFEGSFCLFTGDHGDHIAKGKDGAMWIDHGKRDVWSPMGGTSPNSQNDNSAPPPPVRS